MIYMYFMKWDKMYLHGKKYAVLEITENLVNTIATYINDRVYLTGSLLESNADNRSVFVQFEIVVF